MKKTALKSLDQNRDHKTEGYLKYPTAKLGRALLPILAVAGVLMASDVSAQSITQADAAYDGWLRAYLVNSGGKTYFTNSLTDRDMAFMWGQAYMITGVTDAYDVNLSPERRQLIVDLIKTFDAKNGTDLSWDKWNDDIAWATIVWGRAYQITGQVSYLNAAKKNWDMAYARGWDNNYGGGIWENMDNVPAGGKCALSNWPFVISGALLYLSTGDSNYLTKSEQIYAWTRKYLLDTDTGRVHEQIGPTGIIGDDNTYNSGLIINAANALYKITGKVQYYNDAVLAANHVIKKYPIMPEDHPANGDFGAEQFYRGLGNFARQNNLWPTYSKWFNDNAVAAWKNRRTDYNISQNNMTKPTPTGNLRAMEAEGSVVLQSSIQTSVNAAVLTGAYKIQNAVNSLALTVSGASMEQGASVVQWPFHGEDNALWNFEPTGGGYYHVKNVHSGRVLNVSAASSTQGAKIIQWSAQGLTPGNDHWRPVQNPDGTYYLINLYSQLALDVPSGSNVAGLQLAQWFTNNTGAQKFNLVPQTAPAVVGGPSNGSHALHPQHATNTALDNKGANLVAGNPIDIWQNNGTAAQAWVFSNRDVKPAGYFNISNASGAYCLTATGASSGSPAKLYPCNGSAAQAWRTDKAGNGYHLSPATDAGLCLDAQGGGTGNGTTGARQASCRLIHAAFC